MAMNNTSTKKREAVVQAGPAGATRPTKDVGYRNRGGVNEHQMASVAQEAFGQTLNSNGIVGKIGGGIDHLHNDIGEQSGFITDGYLDKGNTPYGEAAKFNFLPPGMDISNQEMAEIHEMPMRMVTEMSYPGDGWQPTPRDIKE